VLTYGDHIMLKDNKYKIDFDFESYAEKHIFNKLSKSSEYGHYFFPYTYLSRYPKWSTMNEMGFRCKENVYEIRKIYPNHIIITLFGGSTGYSILVPDKDTFAMQLEEKLNSDSDLLKISQKKFKVVNLSQRGNLVLNQIFNYILFCHKLKPEIVISHNGDNDLVMGQINDSTLISKYDIGYSEILESWARKIHKTDIEINYDHSDHLSENFQPLTSKNSFRDVIEAYISRIKQFANIVQSNNTFFISGFQPWLISKSKLTPFEKSKLDNYKPYYKQIYNNVNILCEMFCKTYENKKLDILNLHRIFEQLGDEESHFGDVCHTLSPGDRVIANQYYKKIRSFFV